VHLIGEMIMTSSKNKINLQVDREQQKKIESAYGSHPGNWGDFPTFAGDYINFGYWRNISYDKHITLEQRIESSSSLYSYVISNLKVSSSDRVLEIGCGRGVGLFDALKYMDVSKITGIDISEAQINRSEHRKKLIENKIFDLKSKTEMAIALSKYLDEQFTYRSVQDNLIKVEFIDRLSEAENLVKIAHSILFNIQPKKNYKSDVLDSTNPNKLLDILPVEWKELIERKNVLDTSTDEINEIIKNVYATNFYVGSASSTGFGDGELDKIYSIEVFQHINNLTSVAVEINRILAPNGIVSFCTHLSKDSNGYSKLREKNLLIDEIEYLRPVQDVYSAFGTQGFDVKCEPIGDYVFKQFDDWVTQTAVDEAEDSHKIYESYTSGYIDYYVCTMTRLVGKNNDKAQLTHDEL
jgi:ubiquinone/menaquinone biosynthesis C-methylase UbiE